MRDRAPESAAPLALGVLALMAAVVLAYGATAPLSRAVPVEQAEDAAGSPALGDPALSAAAGAANPTPASSDSARPGRSARPVVAVVGDSLAYSAAGPIDAALRAAGTAPLLHVAPGRRIPVWGLDGRISPGVDAVRALRSSDPAAWVIQLGTNDVAAEPLDREHYADMVRSVLDVTGPDAPVVWVNVHRADRPDESRAFDAVLRIVAAERPELTIADWAAVAATEPVLTDDGVHLSDVGMARFADVIVGAVRSAQPRPVRLP